jgi:hypothetical protein
MTTSLQRRRAGGPIRVEQLARREKHVADRLPAFDWEQVAGAMRGASNSRNG